MIKINQVKCHISHTSEQFQDAICRKCGCRTDQIKSIQILKRSIDARKKPELFYLYTVLVSMYQESKILKKNATNRDVEKVNEKTYFFPVKQIQKSSNRPVIIGAGPAGLFCAYELAMAGFSPLVLERGMCVEKRIKEVENFWNTGALHVESNVQFGEGGAGTFSDGKLNTLVKDISGRNRHVLETFVQFGADEKILYEQKPHLGTDALGQIIQNMRKAIISAGGEFRFESMVTDFQIEEYDESDSAEGKKKITRLKALEINHKEVIPCQMVILAVGHSARETFYNLYEKKLQMEAKPFAVGYRVIHPQSFINKTQYGREKVEELGAAPYKVTAKAMDGRGVYSFCMCPGGYVVNASSELGHTAVNGMSYSKRDSACANSAIIVGVSPEDYESDSFYSFMHCNENSPIPDALKGIAFQRELEKRAFDAASGKVPIEKYGNFKKDLQKSGMILEELPMENSILPFSPDIKGKYTETNVTSIMPFVLQKAFVEGMEQINRHLPGFASDEVWICGIESRTSSPIRIIRDDMMQASIGGIYPCGEGAGYAGGITSAAMDGIKVAEKIALQLVVTQ